jgi:exopolyphosphatase
MIYNAGSRPEPQHMIEPERAETYAAIDLGSNSFHLLVARREHGELRVLDRIKEMVRLGGGLDSTGRLDVETSQRALDCLARFGQRIRGIPADNMRAVGTQTFRRMKKANAFLLSAETTLGCSIDVIAGREEARLIYQGVSQGVSGHDDRKLVIDIGGGSTEFIIGQGPETLQLESVQFGCVSLTRQFFDNEKITRKRWNRAFDAVMAELQEMRLRYLETGWQTAIGSSGTVLAISEICRQSGWNETDIDPGSVDKIRERLLEFKYLTEVQFPGLSEQRQPVLAGGLVMLAACFATFELPTLRTSPYALREGLLYDMLGRLEHRAVRPGGGTLRPARHPPPDVVLGRRPARGRPGSFAQPLPGTFWVPGAAVGHARVHQYRAAVPGCTGALSPARDPRRFHRSVARARPSRTPTVAVVPAAGLYLLPLAGQPGHTRIRPPRWQQELYLAARTAVDASPPAHPA